MTNRAQEIERSLSALAASLSEHQRRITDASTTAEQKSLTSLKHGWDGVVLGYETAALQLTEIAGEIQVLCDHTNACIEILHLVRDSPGLGDVADQIATSASEIDTDLDTALVHLDEARTALEATGEEYLVGILQDRIEQVQASAQSLAKIQKDVAEELGASQPAEPVAAADPTSEVTAVRVQIDELRRQGHAPQRHGAQITDQQLTDRALWGKDPMTGTTTDGDHGGTHKYGRHASKFTSDKALVDADKYIRSTSEYTSARRACEQPNGNSRFSVQIPLVEIFGAEYTRHVHGITREGTKNQPTGDPQGTKPPTTSDFTRGTMKAIYYRSSDSSWNLKTLYPCPQEEQ